MGMDKRDVAVRPMAAPQHTLTVTVTVGGVGFIADVEYYFHDEWYVHEIYPDISEEWPYDYGLYDLLDKWVIDKIQEEVSQAVYEAVMTRGE